VLSEKIPVYVVCNQIISQEFMDSRESNCNISNTWACPTSSSMSQASDLLENIRSEAEGYGATED
jgi:hypothetical protein